nr:hypothetical protein [Tanacetum cinerariifolium]
MFTQTPYVFLVKAIRGRQIYYIRIMMSPSHSIWFRSASVRMEHTLISISLLALANKVLFVAYQDGRISYEEFQTTMKARTKSRNYYRLQQQVAKLGKFSFSDIGAPFFSMLTMSMELSTILQLTPDTYNKTIEARIYRKWIGISLPDLTPTTFCCILIDQERHTIQANMSVKDMDYFDQVLQI